MYNGIEWESQRIHLAVFRSGNLSGAGRLLGIVQETARRRLYHLEYAIRVILFTLTPQGLTPTAGAHGLIEHVEAMDLAAQSLNRIDSPEASVDHGTIRLNCGQLLGIEASPDLLRSFLYKHAGLKLDWTISHALEGIARLQSDIAVRLMRPNEADITVRRVGSWLIGIHASAGCLVRFGNLASLLSLRERPLIGQHRRSA